MFLGSWSVFPTFSTRSKVSFPPSSPIRLKVSTILTRTRNTCSRSLKVDSRCFKRKWNMSRSSEVENTLLTNERHLTRTGTGPRICWETGSQTRRAMFLHEARTTNPSGWNILLTREDFRPWTLSPKMTLEGSSRGINTSFRVFLASIHIPQGLHSQNRSKKCSRCCLT